MEGPDQGAPGRGVRTPTGPGGQQQLSAAEQLAGAGGFGDMHPPHRSVELALTDKDAHRGVPERGQRERILDGQRVVDSLFSHRHRVPQIAAVPQGASP